MYSSNRMSRFPARWRCRMKVSRIQAIDEAGGVPPQCCWRSVSSLRLRRPGLAATMRSARNRIGNLNLHQLHDLISNGRSSGPRGRSWQSPLESPRLARSHPLLGAELLEQPPSPADLDRLRQPRKPRPLGYAGCRDRRRQHLVPPSDALTSRLALLPAKNPPSSTRPASDPFQLFRPGRRSVKPSRVLHSQRDVFA